MAGNVNYPALLAEGPKLGFAIHNSAILRKQNCLWYANYYVSAAKSEAIVAREHIP